MPSNSARLHRDKRGHYSWTRNGGNRGKFESSVVVVDLIDGPCNLTTAANSSKSTSIPKRENEVAIETETLMGSQVI